jgi:hypothetical protein
MWSCFFHKSGFDLSINRPTYAAFVGAQGRSSFGEDSGGDWDAPFGSWFGGVAVALFSDFFKHGLLPTKPAPL